MYHLCGCHSWLTVGWHLQSGSLQGSDPDLQSKWLISLMEGQMKECPHGRLTCNSLHNRSTVVARHPEGHQTNCAFHNFMFIPATRVLITGWSVTCCQQTLDLCFQMGSNFSFLLLQLQNLFVQIWKLSLSKFQLLLKLPLQLFAATTSVCLCSCLILLELLLLSFEAPVEVWCFYGGDCPSCLHKSFLQTVIVGL